MCVVEAHPHPRHVRATEHPDRRAAVSRRRGIAALPVEEPLHIGEEGDELDVVAFLELAGVAGELIDHRVPGVVRPWLFEQFPVLVDLHPRAQGHELERPQQDLSKMRDNLAGGALCDRSQFLGHLP